MKIYVASSWRNSYQQDVVRILRSDGHEVYDFRNPPKRAGFGWEQIDGDSKGWLSDIPRFIERLSHPIAEAGFESDMSALRDADVCVYVLPCGVSASWEAGWAAGAGKRVLVYIPELRELELMLKIANVITHDLDVIRRDLNGSRELP